MEGSPSPSFSSLRKGEQGRRNPGQDEDFESGTSSSDSDSSGGSDHHDHDYDWDPVKVMADLLLNAADGEKGPWVMGMFGGGGDFEMSSILCPFNDSKTGSCFTANCRYKHVQYSSKVFEIPKFQSSLGTRMTEASLPSQMLPAEGCISKVLIVAAFDPGCFYLIPEHGWKCLCRAHEEGENDLDASSKSKQPGNFFNAFENIKTSLSKHFQSHPAATKRSDFNEGELVTVKASSTGNTSTWYRAVVIGEPVCHTDDDLSKPVDVELHLLDYGLRCVKSSVDVTDLPEEFCHVPPLAYKCQLFGVSPILGTWRTVAATTFKELVLGRQCIAEVVRRSLPTAYNSRNDNMGDSSFVNLHIKSESEGDDYINVSQYLIDSGFGLEWNMFPEHPHLNDLLDGRAHKFALF